MGGGGGGGGGGEKNKAWDRQMFSQLAKQSASQRFLERAGKCFAVNSPATANSPANVARVQC